LDLDSIAIQEVNTGGEKKEKNGKEAGLRPSSEKENLKIDCIFSFRGLRTKLEDLGR